MRRFYAKGRMLVPDPSRRQSKGQSPQYVGRKRAMFDGQVGYPATKHPFEYDEKRRELRDMDRRLVKRCRRGELWPADEATARACGVPPSPLRFDDGEWVLDPQPSPKPGSKGLESKETD